ncbi:Allergen Asp f 7 [Penicillium canariense]|uniref:Allergen Asp f 7 n=1 Tax=Penicillium canariense TaxID=189055 RepID=A0A9W9LUA2_9EURO|nr:Allergen Asp f 7 [Penicillium canariense]KAJ5176345.1 Allergen Asp f 7 [Penicillium canariense]
MAPITKTLALAGALFAVSGLAAPVEKRAVVWKTVTDVVWTTVDVTTTLYPGQPTATVVPVVTTAPAEATPAVVAALVQAPQKEEATTSTSTSTSTTSTPVPVPAPTEEATTTSAAPVVQAAAETSSSAAPAATAATSSTQSSGYTGSCSESSPCDGQMTYYDTATSMSNPSSCGTTNDGETEFVLALPHGIMTDSDCGKTVTITYGGVTKSGTVVDKCMGCDNTSVDLSRAFFEAFASLDAGRVSGATWYIN